MDWENVKDALTMSHIFLSSDEKDKQDEKKDVFERARAGEAATTTRTVHKLGLHMAGRRDGLNKSEGVVLTLPPAASAKEI